MAVAYDTGRRVNGYEVWTDGNTPYYRHPNGQWSGAAPAGAPAPAPAATPAPAGFTPTPASPSPAPAALPAAQPTAPAAAPSAIPTFKGLTVVRAVGGGYSLAALPDGRQVLYNPNNGAVQDVTTRAYLGQVEGTKAPPGATVGMGPSPAGPGLAAPSSSG